MLLVDNTILGKEACQRAAYELAEWASFSVIGNPELSPRSG